VIGENPAGVTPGDEVDALVPFPQQLRVVDERIVLRLGQRDPELPAGSLEGGEVGISG
jgi:hypothetical protein